jgi:hypothetical protein
MKNTLRWFLAAVVVLAVIALIAFARGPEHRRGDEIGALTVATVDRPRG